MIVCIYICINLYKWVGWCEISEIFFDQRFTLTIWLYKSINPVLMKGYTWYSSKWPVILDVSQYDFWSRFYIVILGMTVFFSDSLLFYLDFYFTFAQMVLWSWMSSKFFFIQKYRNLKVYYNNLFSRLMSFIQFFFNF